MSIFEKYEVEERMIRGIKEKAVQKGINSQISEYGSVKLYDCDFKNNILNGDLILVGEEEAIEFRCKYKLITDGDEHFIKISSIKLSREWLHKLAKEYIKGNEYEIDGRLSFLIGVLL